MSDSSGPWSNNPSAPQISYDLYYSEKVNLCGIFIAATLYGTITVLFFQCMDALFNPVRRKEGKIKWAFVAHTVAMFLLVTVNWCTNFYIYSTSSIDNREFPGGLTTPLYSKPMNYIPEIAFFLNSWLADGLLLYRCYGAYCMNHRVIAFPCLMYITSIVMSIVTIFQDVPRDRILKSTISFNLVFCPVSLALTILLTLMIIVRLALHGRGMRNTMGSGTNTSKLYETLVTMFVESYALYTLSFIANIAFVGVKNPLQSVFGPIVIGTQVIAPFLIILRVANRRHSASDDDASSNVSSIGFREQPEFADGDGVSPDEKPMNSIGATEKTLGECALGIGNIIEELPRR